MLELETAGSQDYGPCSCCGGNSRRVWGYVRAPGGVVAAYFVHWTVGRVVEHGAHFDFIVGKWGDAATPADRVGVSLEFRRTEQGPAFMVINAADRPIADSTLVGKVLRREEVLGSSLSKEVFSFVDVVWARDDRIAELRGRRAE